MLHTVAHHLGCTAGTFTHILGDVHIYENHFEQVKLQLEQTILESPTIKFNIPPKEDFNYTFEDYSIVGYKHAGKNPASVSVQGKPGTGVKYESKNWIEDTSKRGMCKTHSVVDELPYNNQVIIPIDIFKEDYDRIFKPHFEEKIDLTTINENTEILVKIDKLIVKQK